MCSIEEAYLSDCQFELEKLLDAAPPIPVSTIRQAPRLKHTDTLICLTILQV